MSTNATNKASRGEAINMSSSISSLQHQQQPQEKQQSLLAICCGATVKIWDYSNNTPPSSEIPPTSSSSSPVGTTSAGNNGGISSENGIVNAFQPNGTAAVVTDVAWNHNGQVLASCSDISSPDEPNVVLTSSTSRKRLEAFSTHASTGVNKSRNDSAVSSTSSSSSGSSLTSISFGGRSRYLCVSDTSGTVSIHDMKKSHARVRVFNLGKDPKTGKRPSCTRACVDPTDTYVAALSSSSSDDGILRLYKLREGKLATTLRSPAGVGGGADALHFSSLVPNHVVVGTRDGSVLVWDVTTSSSAAPEKEMSSASSLISSLVQRHTSAVTGVAFSPINRLLLASSSLDGTLAFHDVKTQKTVQVIRVGDEALGRVGVTSFSFHSDGVTCAAGTSDGTVLLYDLRRAGGGSSKTEHFSSLRACSESNSQPVNAVKFADRVSIASSSMTTTIKITQTSERTNAPEVSAEKDGPNKGSSSDDASTGVARGISANAASAGLRDDNTPHPTVEASSLASSSSSQSPSQEATSKKEHDYPDVRAKENNEMPGSLPPELGNATTSKGGTSLSSSLMQKNQASPPLARDLFPDGESGSKVVNDMPAREGTAVSVHKVSSPTVRFREDVKFESKASPRQQKTGTPHHRSSTPGESPSPTSLSADARVDGNGSTSPPLRNKESLSEDHEGNRLQHASQLDSSPVIEPSTSPNVNDNVSDAADAVESQRDMYPSSASDTVSHGASPDHVVDQAAVSDAAATEKFQRDGDIATGHASNIDGEEAAFEGEEGTSARVDVLHGLCDFETGNTGVHDSDGGADIRVNKLVFQSMVENAVESLRDDMEDFMRNLHVDVLRQFQRQSDELQEAFEKQRSVIEGLLRENKELREENERLRRIY